MKNNPSFSQQEGYRAIGPGAILVEKSTLLPYPLRLESDSTGSGWARAANDLDGHQLEQKLTTAGWTFFYIAGAIRTIGFVRLQGCNCLEIDQVAPRSFLGMPYVRISAHAREIQNGRIFGQDSPNGHVNGTARSRPITSGAILANPGTAQ
jgi:hypothetical protein